MSIASDQGASFPAKGRKTWQRGINKLGASFGSSCEITAKYRS